MLKFIKRLFTGDAQPTDTTASPGSIQEDRKLAEAAERKARAEAVAKALEEAERRAR